MGLPFLNIKASYVVDRSIQMNRERNKRYRYAIAIGSTFHAILNRGLCTNLIQSTSLLDSWITVNRKHRSISSDTVVLMCCSGFECHIIVHWCKHRAPYYSSSCPSGTEV
ncbi:hypothetical protein DERF_012419, partial [Dermatophagoides farinae]